eukprot:CAMPEP_0170362974 /NCGR_PEP_ID=MMETSP0117_2-20130122/4616_1 /TAXON_ID=400756 /ORGANISM="Durinskia baltica, Strain CSIRO CS-38" /LENGTH=65 /DNA_ID=CAMNT_0010617423 /DNA_START=58 /DNA_END=253 /DNA_ORIENTATION=-
MAKVTRPNNGRRRPSGDDVPRSLPLSKWRLDTPGDQPACPGASVEAEQELHDGLHVRRQKPEAIL